MPPPISDLTSHLGFWMRMVSNHVSHAFAVRLADKGVTVAEWCLMRTLYGREPMSPSRIADEMTMTRGAITKLADRLISKALIVRDASDLDGRAQTLGLTAKGRRLVPDLAKLADANDAEFFACLSSEDRETLARILKRVAERGDIAATPID